MTNDISTTSSSAARVATSLVVTAHIVAEARRELLLSPALSKAYPEPRRRATSWGCLRAQPNFAAGVVRDSGEFEGVEIVDSLQTRCANCANLW
jgi:hypothetical protein